MLTNGCLKVSFDPHANPTESNRISYITFYIGSIESVKKYLLKFSLVGCKKAKNFQVFLKKREAPYNDLSQRFFCSIDTLKTENQFAFINLVTESDKLLVFEMNEEDSTVFIDNVKLKQQIEKRESDLVLLDINLNSKNEAESGLAIAALLQSQYKVPFIFLTAYNDLDTIRQATRLQPSGYLIKPVNNATLFAALQTAIENCIHHRPLHLQAEQQQTSDYFYIKLGAKAHKVLWSNVYCIEAGKNYVRLRSVEGKGEYAIRGSLNYLLENMVPPGLVHDFLRISRSICLNKMHITSFDNEMVHCNNEIFSNDRIPVKELMKMGLC